MPFIRQEVTGSKKRREEKKRSPLALGAAQSITILTISEICIHTFGLTEFKCNLPVHAAGRNETL